MITADQLDQHKGKKQGGVIGTLMRSGHEMQQELSVELLSKMEAVLEETVLKNIQLQVRYSLLVIILTYLNFIKNDMVTLATETTKLQQEVKQLTGENKQLSNENTHYKEQLVRIMQVSNNM